MGRASVKSVSQLLNFPQIVPKPLALNCCKQVCYQAFPNKGLQQPLYEYLVYCMNKNNGYDWTGELGNLTKHLNLNPATLTDELNGCEFAAVKCSLQYPELVVPETNSFTTRVSFVTDVSCKNCYVYTST